MHRAGSPEGHRGSPQEQLCERLERATRTFTRTSADRHRIVAEWTHNGCRSGGYGAVLHAMNVQRDAARRFFDLIMELEETLRELDKHKHRSRHRDDIAFAGADETL